MSKARVIVLAVVHQGLTKGEAARRYGVSWQWVDTLVARYNEGGLDAVEPRSRRPASNSKATPDAVAHRVVELRKQLDAGGLDAGPVTIAQHLALEDIRPPSTSTIRRILHNAGLVVANPKNSSADTPSTPPAPTGATQTENPPDGHALNDDATHLSTMSRLITRWSYGRYSRFGPLPRFTLESCTGRRTDHSGTVRPSKRHKISQRLTDEERSALIEAYANGASSDKVMQQFGISKSAVLSILDQAGVTRRVQTPTHEQLSEAERLYVEERWSLKRIGQHLGFGDTTIHRHLKLRGVQTRHPWERR